MASIWINLDVSEFKVLVPAILFYLYIIYRIAVVLHPVLKCIKACSKCVKNRIKRKKKVSFNPPKKVLQEAETSKKVE